MQRLAVRPLAVLSLALCHEEILSGPVLVHCRVELLAVLLVLSLDLQ